MTQHEKSDRQVVLTQLICFLFATVLGFSADLFGADFRQIIYKFVDAIFITGTILVAMKLAREGWDMPAAGYTLLSIAWGVFFLAKDFQQQEVGSDILASSFYFLLPSMILITFYGRFSIFIKIITLISILPALISLIYVKMETSSQAYLLWRKISYQSVHIVSLFWGLFIYRMRRENDVSSNS